MAADETSASSGPIIGLAYFERDPKTAREVEKLLQKIGFSFGGRRGGGNTLRRALLVWTLTETGFGDPKAEEFVREKMIPAVTESPWAGAILDVYEAAARVCGGDAESKGRIEESVQFAIGMAGTNPLRDEAREGRDGTGFTPKGDWMGR
jgi:hypothetical protein